MLYLLIMEFVMTISIWMSACVPLTQTQFFWWLAHNEVTRANTSAAILDDGSRYIEVYTGEEFSAQHKWDAYLHGFADAVPLDCRFLYI